MKYRELGKTEYRVSEIGFGGWAIGGSWGRVNKDDAVKALNKAIDLGVNFIDTADVYGDGRSEKIIAEVRKSRKEEIIVATKAGRRLNPHLARKYTAENLEKFVDRSLRNLKVEALDLLQLHCPPTEVYYKPEVFEALDAFVKRGKIRYYGVSVEKVEEAIKAIEYEGVSTVQIVFNMFRQRPKELFFKLAEKKNVGIIARVPLASGLLTGKFTRNTKFESDDHRLFNRLGEFFDRGETFAGVDYEKGLSAVGELRRIIPDTIGPAKGGITLAQFALKWILMHEQISITIPGAKNEAQAEDNASASLLPDLTKGQMKRVENIYEKIIKPDVHQRW